VARAVREVGPVAIDLNSGVEVAPGRKDRALIEEAIRALSAFDPPEVSSWPW
jgi:phosphoribosylanthranilate isomerase